MAKLIHKLSLIRLIVACFYVSKRIQRHYKQLYTVHKRSEAFLQFRLLKSDTKLEMRAWAYVFLVFATCRRNPRNRLGTIVRSGEQNRQAKL